MKVSLLVLPGSFHRKVLCTDAAAERLLGLQIIEEIQSGIGGRQYAVAPPLAEKSVAEQWSEILLAWPVDDVVGRARLLALAQAHRV